MGKIKDFMRDLKVFIAYICLKPFMEIAQMARMFYYGVGELDKPYFWVRFFALSTVFLILVGISTQYWIPAYVTACVTFIAGMRFEWISGRFRKWHIDKIKERAKKQIEEEGKKNG